MSRFLEWLGGSVLVYVVVAACGGSGATERRGDTEIDSGAMGAGGVPGSGGSASSDSGVLADVMNPVPDAHAQDGGIPACDCPGAPEPIVVEAECGTIVDGSPSMWAIAEFPGKTALELIGVRTLVRFPDDLYVYPDGITHTAGAAFVGDGIAAVGCGTVQYPNTLALSVTFVLP